MIALTRGSICSCMNGKHDSSSVNCASDELFDILSFLVDIIINHYHHYPYLDSMES